jgi:hypothetical protein
MTVVGRHPLVGYLKLWGGGIPGQWNFQRLHTWRLARDGLIVNVLVAYKRMGEILNNDRDFTGRLTAKALINGLFLRGQDRDYPADITVR